MNSSHWCVSLWGLLPVWVLCWAGKPIYPWALLHSTSYNNTTRTHQCMLLFPPPCFSHDSLLPGPLRYLPAHSCCGSVKSLCSHSLFLRFHCHSFLFTWPARSGNAVPITCCFTVKPALVVETELNLCLCRKRQTGVQDTCGLIIVPLLVIRR